MAVNCVAAERGGLIKKQKKRKFIGKTYTAFLNNVGRPKISVSMFWLYIIRPHTRIVCLVFRQLPVDIFFSTIHPANRSVSAVTPDDTIQGVTPE